jgi:hypothetical protein
MCKVLRKTIIRSYGEVIKMELQHVVGILLLGISMFCLGYAIAYMQILKKLLEMLEEEEETRK